MRTCAAVRRCLLLLLAACANAPPSGAIPVPAASTVPVAATLAAGTIVRLLPVTGELPGTAVAPAVDGLWREALRQSPWFDIAAGPTAIDDDRLPALQLGIDTAGRSLTASLVGKARQHVAATSFAADGLLAAIDQLALLTRMALGEPIAAGPVPVALLYSADLEAVAQCERALALAQDGNFPTASRILAAARSRDGASTFLLDALASTASVLGQAEAAHAAAEEALALRARLAPTTLQRLGRTLLLAQASLQPTRAHDRDEELLALGRAGRRERPHDPEAAVSIALACNFLGQFESARTELSALATRLPKSASVRYHLGWARLALGDAAAAADDFTRVAEALPPGATVVPRALALYQAGRHDDLRRFLTELAGHGDVRANNALHQIRRMQAAHALLSNRPDDASQCMLDDLAWQLEQPGQLTDRAGEFADAGEVLVRLGHGEQLQPILASVQRLAPSPALAEAAAFVSGLCEAARRRQPVPEVVAGLQLRGATVWGHVLTAFGHHLAGELAAERIALGLAGQQSSSPLVKAALIANLDATGQTTEADTLRQALHRELMRIDLRRRIQHPLLGPELALAWLAQ